MMKDTEKDGHHNAPETSRKSYILVWFLLATVGFHGAFYVCIEMPNRTKSTILNPTVSGSVMYGHVHMAKTAGTTLNGEMASRFERVCGHKGYSYDFWQTNERLNRSRNGLRAKHDVISKQYVGYNRGRVHPTVMAEIGFEDCDYVSHETGWQFWPDTFKNWPLPIELHIPCRDPVAHLMSMCNFKERRFNCTNRLEEEIKSCLVQMERFSSRLVADYTNIKSKCFKAEKIDEYIDYMSHRLQKKRFTPAYIFRETNSPRSPESECIWRDKNALLFTKKYLANIEYYKYCTDCLGSEMDLLRKQ